MKVINIILNVISRFVVSPLMYALSEVGKYFMNKNIAAFFIMIFVGMLILSVNDMEKNILLVYIIVIISGVVSVINSLPPTTNK